MERRSLLRHLLSLGAGNLAKLDNGNYLASSSQHEIKAICHALTRLYDRKLSVARRRAASMTNHTLSPLTSGTYRLLGTPTQYNSIQQYEIVKLGRREFLIIGGVVMAVVVGSALYYVSPGFRTLTETVTSTFTETKPMLIGTTERSKTAETTISTYRMTTSTLWYYMPAQMEQGYEMHFKTARRGKIEDVRRALELEGVAYFQETIHKRFGRWIPRRRIRIGFEREEPAARVQNSVTVQAVYMEYRGGEWKSTVIPSKVLSSAKKT